MYTPSSLQSIKKAPGHGRESQFVRKKRWLTKRTATVNNEVIKVDYYRPERFA